MVLFLRNHEIRGLMNMTEYIEAVEAGYREVGIGEGIGFPRESLYIEGERNLSHRAGHLPSGSKASFQFKGALLPGLGGAGLNAYTTGLPQGLETFMFLFDTDTGALAAVMEVLYWDWLKTAALSAAAIRQLAPASSTQLALFGTGRHARSQLYAVTKVCALESVKAYSRREKERHEFCERMTDELGIDVIPASSPAEALADADIVITITTSPSPVFEGASLPDKPVHINALGAHYPWVREIDEYTVLNSRVFVDEWEQGLKENGEIIIPLEAGIIDESHILGDLAALVAGKVEGRREYSKWTLFLSGGTGIEDVAVCTRIYQKAIEQGIGTEFQFNHPYEYEL